MEHTDIRRKLSAYLDGALGAADRAKIYAHLAGCGSCRKALSDLERTIGRLKSLPELEPPPWLHARIMARVREEALPQQAFWRRIFLPLQVKLPLEAFAIVFICITGYYIARMTAPQAPLTTPFPAPQEKAQPAPQHPTAPSTKAPVKALPPAPQAAPGIPAPIPQHKEGILTYAPPPPPAASATAPSLPEADSVAADKWVEAQREAEWAARRDSYNASSRMAQKRAMPDETRYSTRSSGTSPGAGASRELWPERSEPEAMEERAASPNPAEQPRQIEFALRVDDPAGAVSAIEEAVTRAGGKIVRRVYGEASHLLFVQAGAQNVPALFARLQRIGRLQKPSQAAAPEGGMVEMTIRW